MDFIEIFKQSFGAFWGAFFAFVLGLVANYLKEKRMEKCQIKKLFILMNTNQEAIRTIGELLTDSIEQDAVLSTLKMIRLSCNSKYKIYEVKNMALRLSLEVSTYCKGISLYEKITNQINYQDQVYTQICTLLNLTDTELEEKLSSSNQIVSMSSIMISKSDEWNGIKAELQRLHLI